MKCLLFFCLVLAHGIEATKGKGTKSFIHFVLRISLKSTEECNLGGGFGGGGFGGGYGRGGFGGGFGGGHGGSVLLINHSIVRLFIIK